MIITKSKQIKKILIFIVIFSFIIGDISYASMSESIKFNNLTIEDGLSQSTVEKIYQDSKGYIWIATNDGLDRYNGYEFKHYKNDKYDENSIANNYIIDITEDNNGYIWVSTSGGLSRINPDTDKINNYYAEKDKGNLSDDGICNVLATKDNRIIVATEDGLNLYDEKEDKFIRILDGENELPSQYIYSIKQDYREHIWVGTRAGLVEFDKDFNEISRYEDSIGESDVYTTYEDLNGHIWVGTLRNGLFRINLNNKSIDHYRHDESESSLLSDNVKDVVLDSNRKLWIATDEGLCNFDYETEKFKSYKKESYERDSILDDRTRCLLKDNSGLIWVGLYSGISVFNPNNNFHNYKLKQNDENSLSGNIIYAIYKDSSNTLWVGTNENGLNVINGDSVKHINGENSELLSDAIFDITGVDDNIFVGTNSGLSVFNKNEGNNYTIKNYTEEDGLPANKIRSLFLDSKRNLWIGTNKGLAILNPGTGKITDITYILKEIGSSSLFVRAIYEDSKGNYYIGCFLEGGLIKINPNTKEYKMYINDESDNESISNNTIRYITEDLDGNLLIGTSHGLNILNQNTDKFKHYTENDGLVNNTVYGVLVDKNNDIWMSTNGGISKLALKDESFKNFTVEDGLLSNEFNGRACFKGNDEKLYFGSINGLSIIDINNLKVSTFKPKVIFDSFEVNGIKKEDISNQKFKHNYNNIKVKLFSNNYTNTRNTKYYYRLNGLEEKWYSTNNNSITFANLAPGKYSLEVKTITQQGIESEVNSVNFTIKTPFWKSKYAMFLYCILIILIMYIQSNKVKRLDKLVDKRTKELREEMYKNKELYNQVIVLEQSKNNYFVNMSHELRTPLNVLNSINQLIKSFTESDELMTKEKLSYYMDVMGRNCTRLLNLINNLIDYAKIENNSYIIDKRSVDIVYLVEETALGLKDYIEANKIEFIFDTDVEEKIIECDQLDIERCVVNLVSNAIKFTPEGGLIEVFVEDLNDKVKISVKDNGVGISEENQKLIFDRFNQGTERTSGQKVGSGLGLTITKQIISLHGGDIYVNSKVDVGSEFVIILPVK